MTDPCESGNTRAPDLLRWEDCDFFCIHDYANAGGSPCGWRGRIQDVRRDQSGSKVLCPRCGCATLFRIPLNRVEDMNC